MMCRTVRVNQVKNMAEHIDEKREEHGGAS